MGRIARILSFLQTERNGAKQSDVKVDRGGDDNRTAIHFTDPGDDSQPLTTDYVLVVNVGPTGSDAVAGYLDPVSAPKSSPGDKRIYARDSSGATVVELWLKNDGTAILSNDNGSLELTPGGGVKGTNSNGSFELEEAGDFVVNGVTIDTAGNIDSPASVSAPSIKANSKELAGHNHAITGGSSAPGPTGPNN